MVKTQSLKGNGEETSGIASELYHGKTDLIANITLFLKLPVANNCNPDSVTHNVYKYWILYPTQAYMKY